MASKAKGAKAVENIRLERLSIEYVPIDWVKPNAYNPNRIAEHEFDLLKRSISQDGMTQPVIVMTDGTIVDGEQRWRACSALGFTEVPVVKVDMTEEQRRIATIRHNIARGTHDIELEADVLRDLEKLGALDYAQEALQLTDVEIERMLKDLTPLDAYGGNEKMGESWDYSRMDNDSPGADTASGAARQAVDNARAVQQAGMEAADPALVRTHITVTREENNTIVRALGDDKANTLVAMAQAHADAKDRAHKGDWASLTFLVPVSALPIIENELKRLHTLAPGIRKDLTPELLRGLALEYMAVLSAQTPTESLQ